MTWIGTEAALARLGVRVQTLYAYVSRGRVEARPDPHDPRRSLYSSADIDSLVRRRVRGRRAAAVAQEAIAWGEPVLDSAVSTVVGGRLVYRGVDAVALAETASLEEVAALLWPAPEIAFPSALRSTPPSLATARRTLFQRMAERAGAPAPALGRPPQALRREAAEIVGEIAQVVAGVTAEPGERVHDQVARSWSLDQEADPTASGVIRRALVLLADHELNASTFAARVAASTGASLAAATLCGLSALCGPLHGGAAQAVARLAQEAGRLGAAQALRPWQARGGPIPGFGHPRLYPHGDARATAVLRLFEPRLTYRTLARIVGERSGLEPNVDFALAAAADRFGFPADAPFLLFALARSVGWLAHALEQGEENRLIRPRARYTGPGPTEP